MAKKKVSIVVIQTAGTKNLKQNFRQAVRLMHEALTLYKYVDVVVFPEHFAYFPDNSEAHLIKEIPDIFIRTFSVYAKTYNTYIIAGTVANRRDGKIYNTSLLFDRRGEVVGSYDKIHLFDALNAAKGNRESDLITPGDHVFTYGADFGKIGIIVCYDVRFPELSRTLALKGAEYLFVPTAFFMPRFDHWQSLIKNTALQNSMYVAGANLTNPAGGPNRYCGRSLIADPWGIAIATASDKPGFIQAYVDADYPKQIRDAAGTFNNRVPSIYDIPRE
jgi:omega-amidase